MGAQMTSIEGGTPSQQPGHSTTHPLSPTLKKVCWPEFRTLQDEFSIIVSKVSEALRVLEPAKFESLLVYLRERLRPMVDGCFPSDGSANLPDDPITPSELFHHLQKSHYWDYLNTNLLEGIIRRVTEADSPLQSAMKEYKSKVVLKVTCTLEDCEKKGVKPEPPRNYTIMAVEINRGGNPLRFHLHQILQLRDQLVETFGVSDALFAGFGEGSIVLYFFIPEEAVYSLCPKLESKCAVLEELHVTTVVVFDHFSVDVSFQQMSLLGKVGITLTSYLVALSVCKDSITYTVTIVILKALYSIILSQAVCVMLVTI